MVEAILCLMMAAGGWQQASSASAPAAASEQPFRISGTLVDALSGRVLANGQVSISAQGVRDSNRALVTDGDGRFAFENVAAGKYALIARRKGYLEQFYKQHEQFSTAIIVGPGLNSENLRFEMRPEASISGQVVDETGEAVRNAHVMLFRHGLALGRRTNWQQNTASTDDLGRYHFGHLVPGTYYVAVSAQPWYAQRVMQQGRVHGGTTYFADGVQTFTQTAAQEEPASDPNLDLVYPVTFFPRAPDIAGAATITVRAGDAQTADFQLQPVPAVHMIVRVASGEGPAEDEYFWAQVTQPLADGIQIGVSASSQQISPGVVEVFGLPPGHFNLRLGSNRNGDARSFAQAVQVSGDTEVTLGQATASGTVSGVVRLENGAALTPAPTLFLRARNSGEQFFVQVEANGEFKMKGQTVAPGTYDVLVGQPGAVAVKSMSATGAKVNGRNLEIASGQDVTVSIVLSQGNGRVTGVALKDGKPVDGVMIVLVPEVPEHNLVLFRRDQSDSDGSFSLQGIHPGKYTVVAIENGWELEWLTPGTLAKYLSGGQVVQVEPNAKLEVKVNVQQ